MRQGRPCVLFGSALLLALGVSGCFDWDSYDPRLHAVAGEGGTGAAGNAGGTGGEGGGGAEGGEGGGGAEGGAGGGGAEGGGGSGGSEPCAGNTFECSGDGTARECDGGSWVSLGSCPLGCDAATRACLVPSNVSSDLVGIGEQGIAVGATEDLVFDTDTGEITSSVNGVVRAAGEGLDATSGIAFNVASQGGGDPGLGVFSMDSLAVPSGGSVRGVGANAFVLLVDGDVTIDGLVTVEADGRNAGPGGYEGGAIGQNGQGPCPGHAGSGSYVAGSHCTSGGAGAGHGATGGAGGDCVCTAPNDHAGGTGGPATCGTDELVPLVGGSGGAGGTSSGDSTSDPGVGGGGGGALQVTAAGTITVGASGRINAGGGGGGQTINGGGTGGGAGGGLLLEAPSVTVSVGAVLAANGGGGGGGDCD